MNFNRDLYIYGAGGFGREVYWLIERINENHMKKYGYNKWNVKGFIDDSPNLKGEKIYGFNIYDSSIFSDDKFLNICLAIGSAKTRERIANKLELNKNINFPNLIDPSVLMSETIRIGKGVIICAGNILTVDIKISDFVIINLNCTVGHDTYINNFVTLYPGVNLSGNCKVGKLCELGTNSCVLQNLKIGNNNMIGAGAVVTKNFENNKTIVGVPGKELI